MRLTPEEIPVYGGSFKWLNDITVWKQGELDYACGPAALMTAALFIKAIQYDDCDFARLSNARSCMRALTQGISFEDLTLFAQSISSEPGLEPNLHLSLFNAKEPFPEIKQHTQEVWLLRACVSYRDPHTWGKTPEYSHIAVVLGESDGRLLVADPHPWADNAISWVARDQLKMPKSQPEWTQDAVLVSKRTDIK